MPELPEVETVKRGLLKLIVEKVVKSATSDNAKSFPNSPADVKNFLINSEIINVRRRAKVLIIDLSTNYSLVVHLKMTGQLVFVGKHQGLGDREMGNGELRDSGIKNPMPNTQSLVPDSEVRFAGGHPNDSLVNNLPDKSTRVIIEFTDGTHLYFNDQRKFGWVRLMPTDEIINLDFFKRVGPEPLEPDFSFENFRERFIKRSKTNIKAALLDQSVIAGVGNIYADESLFGAHIHPRRIVGSLTDDELLRLYEQVRFVMNLSIEKGGSTNRNYVNAEGKKGSYMEYANVFRRDGQNCPICGSTITKTRVAGRGTHVCPECQKLA